MIQTQYRDKCAKEDPINQEEDPTATAPARVFRKTNHRDKIQFAYGYEGEKIPITHSEGFKTNPLKILKAAYRIHKDKVETRGCKKTCENVRSSKLPEFMMSNRLLDSGLDVYELKRGI